LYRKIDHVAIAVRSIEAARSVYSGVLGLGPGTIEEIPEQRVRAALLPVGESRIELLEAAGEGSPIAAFLDKRGEGLHHICFEVDDLDAEITRLRAAGMRLVDQAPRTGAGGCRITFLHPSGTSGVLIELSQPGAYKTTESHSE